MRAGGIRRGKTMHKRREREQPIQRFLLDADFRRAAGLPANDLRRLRVMRTVCALALCCIAHCAVLAPERRVLTTTLDENLTPPSPAARAALTPLAVPVGLVALGLDAVLINPIAHIPDSYKNANVVFTEIPYTEYGEIVVFPMRVLTYPVIFVGSMLFYAMVPLE